LRCGVDASGSGGDLIAEPDELAVDGQLAPAGHLAAYSRTAKETAVPRQN
jgi:hypothetical protein